MTLITPRPRYCQTIVSRGGLPLIARPYIRSTRSCVIPKPTFPIRCQGTIRGGSGAASAAAANASATTRLEAKQRTDAIGLGELAREQADDDTAVRKRVVDGELVTLVGLELGAVEGAASGRCL